MTLLNNGPLGASLPTMREAPDDRNMFIGAVHDIMSKYAQVHGKPMGDKEIQAMARSLCRRLHRSELGGLARHSAAPRKCRIIRCVCLMLPVMVLSKIGEREFGAGPNEEQIHAVYIAREFQAQVETGKQSPRTPKLTTLTRKTSHLSRMLVRPRCLGRFNLPRPSEPIPWVNTLPPFANSSQLRQTLRHEHGQGSGGAAKALNLARSTGMDPIVINADVPTFQNQYKAKLADDMIRGNSQLDMYIRSHPLAAQVSMMTGGIWIRSVGPRRS